MLLSEFEHCTVQTKHLMYPYFTVSCKECRSNARNLPDEADGEASRSRCADGESCGPWNDHEVTTVDCDLAFIHKSDCPRLIAEKENHAR